MRANALEGKVEVRDVGREMEMEIELLREIKSRINRTHQESKSASKGWLKCVLESESSLTGPSYNIMGRLSHRVRPEIL
ncbi:hypothetical protein SLS60_009106 [Paraconiothyrium brasiliense]|uniref:Uncharacterized protein n=1 Tax=Paraconiothyrium brasiliense TaxID=300254 RepID=A0ABR3QWC1_9PLEO